VSTREGFSRSDHGTRNLPTILTVWTMRSFIVLFAKAHDNGCIQDAAVLYLYIVQVAFPSLAESGIAIKVTS
jgi:hypothetical protein